MNKNEFTTEKIQELINKSFEVLVNKYKYNLSNEDKKSLYSGFYAGYKFLMLNKKIPDNIKNDIISKKQILDKLFSENITNPNNMVKIHKNVANKIKINTGNINNFANKLAKLKIKP